MKHFITLLAVLCTGIGYGQQLSQRRAAIGIAICNFELQHTKELEKYAKSIKDTLVTVHMEFTPEGVLATITYFKGRYNGRWTDGPLQEVSMWPGLDAFIRSQYAFMPAHTYDIEDALMDDETLELYLYKKDIVTEAEYLKDDMEAQDEYYNGIMSRFAPFDILPEARFTLKMQKLVIDGIPLPPQEIKGRLLHLESGVVRLGPDCYLTFRVLRTSESGMPAFFLQYRLFVIKEQVLVYARETMAPFDPEQKEIHLAAQGNRTYSEPDDEGNPGPVITSPDSYDFDIQITFSEP